MTEKITGNWDGVDGALTLDGDKPTLKLDPGPIAGERPWIVHVGSNGPGNLEFFRQGAATNAWNLGMALTPGLQCGFGTSAPAPGSKVEVVGNWNGVEGALRLTGDKPTMKLAAGSIAGNATWIVHVGSNGPGNLEFYRQDGAPDRWKLIMGLTTDGNVIVPGDILLRNADFAEEFDIAGSDSPHEPGSVMVLDERLGAVRLSDEPYDARVAGVIAGAGDYKPAIVADCGARTALR